MTTQGNHDDNDDILESNVSTLLETGGDAPRMTDIARARIRGKLIEDFGAKGGAATGARKRSPALAIGAGLAAVAAVAVVATVVGRGGGGGDASAGSDGAIALADGSTAIAAPGATVTVVGARHVRVSGEVLLDVAPGQGTFTVDTAVGHVEVLGTRFVVDGEAARTTTAVVRGEVKLVNEGDELDLHAGEQGVAEPGKRLVRSAAPRLSHLVSWAEQTRRHLETTEPVHHGTLYARQPNAPWAPEEPLPIAKLGVDVVVQDRVARVAIDQTFHNDAPMDLEGMYRFSIPPDAALQRLAMYVDGKLTESAVVERMAARKIYEEQVYRRVDPALLEWQGTGKLALRVYPLPARQDKRLMVAYTQSLPELYGDWTLTVPLPDVDQPVGDVSFTVHVARCANCEITSTSHEIEVARAGEDATVTYHATGAKLGDSLVLHVRDLQRGATVADASDGGDRYLMVRAPADLGAAPAAYRPRTWVVLDDVSASRDAMARRAQADVIDALLRELDEDDRVAVVAFDVEARTKLATTRVRDVDRQAVRAALASDDGGVGATDFGVGLDAALAQLAGAGVSADDAMVVYLGDGVVTSGTQHLDELRAKLVGHAHFVGVGVGDGPDTQTLDALAAATGGYATTIDFSDDLGWRTFDLVAALHTARVTDVRARLVDGAGADVAATAYLRAPQLADGEEIELVARLDGAAVGALPAAVELSGTRDGKPWQQRITVNGSRGDAGYLPRLWGQRRIAALLLAKHEPVVAPPCVPKQPCQTPDEVRDARDEVLRKEIVELGKRYFLLSRHTSLLVLENDAMYRQYGITKGRGDTWAPYAMPATVPVAHGPLASLAAAGDDALLVRIPVSAFADYGYGNRRYHAAVHRGMMDNPLASEQPDGFGAHGYGPGGGGNAPAATRATETMSLEPAEPDYKDSDKHESSDLGDGLDEGKSMPKAEKKASYVRSDGWRGNYGGEDLAVDFEVARKTGELGLGNEQADLGGLGGLGPYNQLYVQRYVDPADTLFDDLTAQVAGFFPDDVEAWQATIGAAARPQPIDPAAHELLERARRAFAPGTYRWADTDVAVDAAGTFAWTRTTGSGLVERAAFANGTWTRDYAELDLELRRGDVSPLAMQLATLPMWIGDDDVYRTHYAVRAKGDHAVALVRRDNGADITAFVMTFDDAAHLTRVTDGAGHELVAVTWDGGRPAAGRVRGRAVAAGPGATATAATGPAPTTVVDLPLHLPNYWRTRLDAAHIGSDDWRRAARQQLATLAALQQSVELGKLYRELLDHGGVSLGDLVLASGAAAAMSDQELAVAVAPFAATPVGKYVAASHAYRDHAAVHDVPPASDAGMVSSLWSLREISAAALAGHADVATDRLVAMGDRAPALRVIGAALIGTRASSSELAKAAPMVVRAWDAVATGPRRNIARAEAVWSLYRLGAYEAAATQLDRYVDELDLAAPPAAMQQLSYVYSASGRGNAGWQLAWTKLRDRVLAGASFEHVMALADVAAAQGADLQRILTRAAELAGSDVDRVLAVANLASRYGKAAWAQALLEPFAQRGATRELHQTLGQLAQQQGRTADALAQLEAAQDLAGDEPTTLAQVRAELAQIIGLARDLALQTSGQARADAVARALRWGARWRAIDPGNTQVDSLLGDLELALGNSAAAWRELSTVIERDPMSGDGYQLVANAFEMQGRVAEALPYWEQALRIDQTNPTPRFRKAQALAALGRRDEADAVLRDIAGRTWHERWAGIADQARALLERPRTE